MEFPRPPPQLLFMGPTYYMVELAR